MVFFFLFFFFLGATVWVMTDLSVSTYIHIHDLARPDASLFFFSFLHLFSPCYNPRDIWWVYLFLSLTYSDSLSLFLDVYTKCIQSLKRERGQFKKKKKKKKGLAQEGLINYDMK